MIGAIAYTLCALTACLCATLLLRAHRRTRSPLLWWSGLCFVMLTVSNVMVAVDLVVFPDVNLFFIRNAAALGGMLLLVYGLVWRSE